MNNDNQVIIILSESRSGSTWLSYVLGSHTNAAHLGEYFRPFTMPGHIACRLCEAKGKSECEILHGIENVIKEDAHNFAFERFQKKTLIDSSKQLDWVVDFSQESAFQTKVIHLFRDPRSWYASERRRKTHLTVSDAMERWLNTNQTISSTLDEHSISYVTAYYEELCIKPEIYFNAGVNEYLKMPFEEAALEYWNFQHHGLGGNGAAFNNLSGYPKAKMLTGDDEYYNGMKRKRFYDARWLDELSPSERSEIENMETLNTYLKRQNRSFAHFDALLAQR